MRDERVRKIDNGPLPGQEWAPYDSMMGRKMVGKKIGSIFLPNIFLPPKSSLLKRCMHCAHVGIPVFSVPAGR